LDLQKAVIFLAIFSNNEQYFAAKIVYKKFQNDIQKSSKWYTKAAFEKNIQNISKKLYESSNRLYERLQKEYTKMFEKKSK
jgi:hypothetical protein